MGDSRTATSNLWAGRPKLVLASSSPRRRELLERLGALAEVKVPDVAEQAAVGGDARARAVRLSRLKAESVARRLDRGLVLGADTLVVMEGRVLGKPRSEEEARDMLRLLSARTHEVVTGITVIDAATGRSASRQAVSRVTFRPISDAEVEAYVATGEPMDKAGAYGAQGGAGFFIEAVDGCFYNVVGLPLALLAEVVDELAKA